MKNLLPPLALAIALLTQTSALASPACPQGLWDLGPGAAALYLECSEKEHTARLSFCKRSVVIEGRDCNHIGLPLSCQAQADHWLCLDNGASFRAEIRWIGEEQINYGFKSSFNSGSLNGKRF